MIKNLELEIRKLIEHYRTRKNDNIFDDFYTSDLYLIEVILSTEEMYRTSGKFIYEYHGLYISEHDVEEFKQRINSYRKRKNEDFTDIFYHVHLDYMEDLITKLNLVTEEEVNEVRAKRSLNYNK